MRDDLLKDGKKPAEVARLVGAARQTVYTWKSVFDEGGIDALRFLLAAGRPPRLDESQLQDLRRTLLQKPTEFGFESELWTLKRVGVLIQPGYGVKFGLTTIWLILGALGFSAQKPERRAIERNPDEVRDWRHQTWAALKKNPARGTRNRLH